MSKVNTSAARFREIRQSLGLTQQQLADRLMLSRNYIAQIEMGSRDPSIRVLSAAESMLTESPFTSRFYRQPVSGAPTVEEDRPDVVAPRKPTEARKPGTRQDCEAYVAALLQAAADSGDPNAFPVILHRLKKEFPLDEWANENEKT